MKAGTFILLLLSVITILLVNGCMHTEYAEKTEPDDIKNENNNENNNMEYSIKTAVVTVTEIEKNRTHKFNYYSKEEKIMLSGNFSINNELYPGKIIYYADKTLLFRPDPNQAVIFPEKHVTYGFLPPEFISSDNDANIKVLENNTVIKYKIKTPDAESIIEITGMKRENININFDLPDDTQYIKSEELVINVN